MWGGGVHPCIKRVTGAGRYTLDKNVSSEWTSTLLTHLTSYPPDRVYLSKSDLSFSPTQYLSVSLQCIQLNFKFLSPALFNSVEPNTSDVSKLFFLIFPLLPCTSHFNHIQQHVNH